MQIVQASNGDKMKAMNAYWVFLLMSMSHLANSANAPYQWETHKWDKSYNTAHNAQYLTQLEQDIISQLNRARAEPKTYAKTYIKPRAAFFNGLYYKEPDTADNFLGIKTHEGSQLIDETVNALNKTTGIGLLMPNKALHKAARRHAVDQSKTGSTGHNGSDNSTPKIRIEHEGTWTVTMGENIMYGPNTGRDVVAGLLVDDGVPSRGHRINILNAAFTVVGVACSSHPKYRTVCVMDFAGGME